MFKDILVHFTDWIKSTSFDVQCCAFSAIPMAAKVNFQSISCVDLLLFHY